MDRDQIKKLFDNPQVCDGCVSVTVDAWNIIAREVNKVIADLEKENMQLRADLDAITDLATLPQPAVNIENVTVNYYAGA